MKLGLGTVQFGLDYGVSNRQGQTAPQEAAAILEVAAQQGVRVVDTAHLYGNSEAVLGRMMPAPCPFDIVTKTPALKKNEITAADCSDIRDAFTVSLERLRQDSVYGLLFHHADDLQAKGGGRLYDMLQQLKSEGKVTKIGASVYDEEQIDFLLDRYPVDLVQLPLNVFDQRLIRSKALERLKEKGIEIHIRSAFLQGVIFMQPDEVPVEGLKKPLAQFLSQIAEAGYTPLDAALGFVMSRTEIDSVVCGVNTAAQFSTLCRATKNLPSFPDRFFDAFAIDDARLVNPALWPEKG